MPNSKVDARIRDQLTLCLSKAIHTALSARLGQTWFADFSAEEADFEPAKRIVQNGQTSLFQCDLQACLKLLRYREAYCTQVLEHYHFFDPKDPQNNAAKSKQLTALLDRLIRDYRNAMDAHTRACDIESGFTGKERSSLYGKQDAVNDMIKLAEIFAVVCDGSGVPYYRRMCSLRDGWLASMKLSNYRVSDAIAHEKLQTDSAQFLQCCEALGIPIVTVGGELCFSSADYCKDMDRIRDRLSLLAQAMQKPKKRRVWPWLLVIAALLTVLLLGLALLLAILGSKFLPIGDPTQATAGTTEATNQASAGSPLPTDTTAAYNEDNVFFNPTNYDGPDGEVTVKPRYVYWEDGCLVAECFIINNLDATTARICIESLKVSNQKYIIAQAGFGELEDLMIEPNSYEVWTLRFLPDSIVTPNADLSHLRFSFSVNYLYQ